MIAVADTSPLCYLILIDEVDLLRELFTRAVVPISQSSITSRSIRPSLATDGASSARTDILFL